VGPKVYEFQVISWIECSGFASNDYPDRKRVAPPRILTNSDFFVDNHGFVYSKEYCTNGYLRFTDNWLQAAVGVYLGWDKVARELRNGSIVNDTVTINASYYSSATCF